MNFSNGCWKEPAGVEYLLWEGMTPQEGGLVLQDQIDPTQGRLNLKREEG